MVDVVGRAVLKVTSDLDERSFDQDGKKIGASFRKGALIGVAALATLAAAGVKAGLAAEEAAKKQRVFTRVLANMGKEGAAGRLSDIASELGKITGIDDEVILGAETILASFKSIASSADVLGGTFDKATQASLDLAATPFFNGNVEGAARALGLALNDPERGLIRLTRAGVPFTAQQKQQIKDFIQSNDLASAQALILDEVTRKFGGLAAESATGSERLRTAVGEAQEAIGFLLTDLFDTGGKKSVLDLAADATFEFSDAVTQFQKSTEWRDLRNSMGDFGSDLRTVAKALGTITTELDDLSVSITGSGLLHWLGEVGQSLWPLIRMVDLLADIADLLSQIGDEPKFKGSSNKELTDLLLGDFASGGTVGKTGAYRVGETGPEIVTLPRGAQVMNSRETRRAMGNNVNVAVNLFGPQTSIGIVRQADFAYKFATQTGG